MQDLISWIKDQQAKGYINKQLEEYLVSKGYDKNQVDALFLEIESKNYQNKTAKNTSPKWIWIIVSMAILVAITASYLILSGNANSLLAIKEQAFISNNNENNTNNLSNDTLNSNIDTSLHEITTSSHNITILCYNTDRLLEAY